MGNASPPSPPSAGQSSAGKWRHRVRILLLLVYMPFVKQSKAASHGWAEARVQKRRKEFRLVWQSPLSMTAAPGPAGLWAAQGWGRKRYRAEHSAWRVRETFWEQVRTDPPWKIMTGKKELSETQDELFNSLKEFTTTMLRHKIRNLNKKKVSSCSQFSKILLLKGGCWGGGVN